MALLKSIGHGSDATLKLTIWLILAMAASRPALASDMCDDVTAVLTMKQTLKGAPTSVSVGGETSGCSVSPDGATWTCKLASAASCKPRDPKGGAIPVVDPGPVIARHRQVVAVLKTCLASRSAKDFQRREAITDDYVRVVKGTRFEDETGREPLTPQVSLTGEVKYESTQICENLSAGLEVR